MRLRRNSALLDVIGGRHLRADGGVQLAKVGSLCDGLNVTEETLA